MDLACTLFTGYQTSSASSDPPTALPLFVDVNTYSNLLYHRRLKIYQEKQCYKRKIWNLQARYNLIDYRWGDAFIF